MVGKLTLRMMEQITRVISSTIQESCLNNPSVEREFVVTVQHCQDLITKSVEDKQDEVNLAAGTSRRLEQDLIFMRDLLIKLKNVRLCKSINLEKNSQCI